MARWIGVETTVAAPLSPTPHAAPFYCAAPTFPEVGAFPYATKAASDRQYCGLIEIKTERRNLPYSGSTAGVGAVPDGPGRTSKRG